MWFLSEKGGNAIPSVGSKKAAIPNMLKNSALFTKNDGALLSDGAKICRCCENRSGDSTYDVSTEKGGTNIS